jgi:hypothetical protein
MITYRIAWATCIAIEATFVALFVWHLSTDNQMWVVDAWVVVLYGIMVWEAQR